MFPRSTNSDHEATKTTHKPHKLSNLNIAVIVTIVGAFALSFICALPRIFRDVSSIEERVEAEERDRERESAQVAQRERGVESAEDGEGLSFYRLG